MNISETNFDPGVGTVFVANGLASADALAAGPVAGMGEGPILLVKKDSIPSAVASELERLNPARIVVLGGTGSVSATVESKLKAYAGSVVRWAGADRYVVSVNISETNFDPGVGTVFVANGLASADALAAGPVAGMGEGPILLVKKDSIPSAVASELERLNPARIVVLGGTGSVAATVESKLKAYTGSVVRWAGADRYVVSANISATNFDPGVGTVFVANGLALADALAAGPVAGMGEGPILLVKKDSIPSAVVAGLERLDPARIVVLGGTGSVSTTVEEHLLAYLEAPGPVITVPLNAAPTLTGVTDVTITAGDSFSPLTGVTAIDLEDGDLTATIRVTGTVDISNAGEYTLTYSVTDSNGKTATATRTVTVTANAAPTLSGVTDVTLTVGDTFSPLAGVSATDEEDGDLTDQVNVTGSVDTTTAGVYTLTYTVTDTNGNTTTLSRVVTVQAPAPAAGITDYEQAVTDRVFELWSVPGKMDTGIMRRVR